MESAIFSRCECRNNGIAVVILRGFCRGKLAWPLKPAHRRPIFLHPHQSYPDEDVSAIPLSRNHGCATLPITMLWTSSHLFLTLQNTMSIRCVRSCCCCGEGSHFEPSHRTPHLSAGFEGMFRNVSDKHELHSKFHGILILHSAILSLKQANPMPTRTLYWLSTIDHVSIEIFPTKICQFELPFWPELACSVHSGVNRHLSECVNTGSDWPATNGIKHSATDEPKYVSIPQCLSKTMPAICTSSHLWRSQKPFVKYHC